MRYSQLDSIIFTGADGVPYPVKDNLPVQKYEIGSVIATQANDDLDEICSRREVYGDDNEWQVYAVVDHNIVKLYENGFNVGALRALYMPVLTD